MNIFDLLPGDGQNEPRVPQTPPCSRRGCRANATMQLLWNNPKIHTVERRKIWLACDDHVAWLEDYLQSRSLWKDTVPLSQPTTPPKDSA